MLEKFITPRRKAKTDYVEQLPAGARRIDVFHNLTKITGWAWGEAGPSILLIHGWEGHTGRMIPLIEPLLQQGYRVFTLDAPGHGLSPATKTNLVDVGYAIQAMMEQHGPFFGIIAHSFGAAATAIMLAREPQLMPEKLVLLSPMRDLQQHFDIFASIAQLSPTLKKRVRELAVKHVGQSFESVSTVKGVSMLRNPGLVIHDWHDTLIPYEVGETIAHHWHGCQFISTEKLGHRMGLTRASVRQHILMYLAQTPQIVPDVLAQATNKTTPNEDRKIS
ncbi:MAG: alpha/beta fold hydrolase [Aggregatilineales bacterium]